MPAGGATWATLPMGDLGQPLNTFWQLLELPPGSSQWTNQVEVTAVATNGGIVLDSGPAGMVAAVRPSNMLTYSPLVITADAGSSWTQGLIDASLVDRPGSLSSGTADAFALVAGSGGTLVLRGSAALDGWHPLADQRTLAASAGGRTCGLTAVTAVADLAGSPVVGAACGHAGTVGVLAQGAGGQWRLAGPALPAQLRGDRVEVVDLWPDGQGEAGLLELSGGGHERVAAAFSPDGSTWTLSPELALPGGGTLTSVGVTGNGGVFVLAASGQGELLDVCTSSGSGWQTLPAPPRGTSTVAFPIGTAPSALVVDHSTVNVFTLRSSAWSQSQRLDVTIQFGSSS